MAIFFKLHIYLFYKKTDSLQSEDRKGSIKKVLRGRITALKHSTESVQRVSSHLHTTPQSLDKANCHSHILKQIS